MFYFKYFWQGQVLTCFIDEEESHKPMFVRWWWPLHLFSAFPFNPILVYDTGYGFRKLLTLVTLIMIYSLYVRWTPSLGQLFTQFTTIYFYKSWVFPDDLSPFFTTTYIHNVLLLFVKAKLYSINSVKNKDLIILCQQSKITSLFLANMSFFSLHLHVEAVLINGTRAESGIYCEYSYTHPYCAC